MSGEQSRRMLPSATNDMVEAPRVRGARSIVARRLARCALPYLRAPETPYRPEQPKIMLSTLTRAPPLRPPFGSTAMA
jgi:hypothetical protein